jgi:hypothetical protein
MVSTPSLDHSRQSALRQTVVSNTISSHSGPSVAPNETDDSCPDPGLRNVPHSFVASYSLTIDSATNRLIVNDAKLLKNFRHVAGNVKGISGAPTSILGEGTVDLPLQSDDGTVDVIRMHRAVYVPSSPYNLVPPQLIVTALKKSGRRTEWFKHDDKHYIFEYHGKNGGSKRTLTTAVDERGMFAFRTKTGYNSFFCQACKHQPEWEAFPGSAHVVEDSDDESIGQTRETSITDKPREPPREPPNSEPSREPDQVPYDDGDFSVDTAQPIEAAFEVPPTSNVEEDPQVAIVRRKQHRLAVIHEKFGHLSFATLKLMARAGLIPKELATVDPPTCPGCAYGKAHRKPWRRKGVKNRRTIKVATRPGHVVSVDQLISPTPGFIPTHRGIPTTVRYTGATVFVDHFSDFTYVHLMSKMDGDATVEAKQAFERVLESHGVKALHYVLA